MIHLALRSLLARPLLTALTGIALMTVAISAGTVATFARSTQAEFIGDADRAWDTPYDLLVRPIGSQAALEASDGLVRPNFMAGVQGGISPDQLDEIRSIEGVEVAAPIAMVGFVNWYSVVTMPLPHDVSGVYRVTARSVGESGLSQYDIEDRFIVISPDGSMMGTDERATAWMLFTSKGQIECRGSVECFARSICQRPTCSNPQPMLRGFNVDDAQYDVFVAQPLIIAGVDPAAEARLAKIDSCVVSGRYLEANDHPTDSFPTDDLERIPVLASNRSFVDETLTFDLSRAVNGDAIFAGTDPARLQPWEEQASLSLTVDDLYQDLLHKSDWGADPYPIWSAGDVAYEQLGVRRVRPTEVEPNLGIYRLFQGGVGSAGPEVIIPPAARDRAFRDVEAHSDGYVEYPGSKYRLKIFEAVGTYDPSCIPGWDQLAGGKLDAYSYPSVRLEDGRLLTPTRSMSGYVNSPPLMLTTLDSAAWLSDPQRFHGQPGRRFISVVRVKVRGAENPGALGEARLQHVAAAIHDRTGLLVDVVKGSSLADVAVELPPGRFGRPAELATEGWSKKGVVVRFVEALETSTLGLLAIGYAVAATYVAAATFTSIRRRRREFGALRALGWPTRRLALLIELEVVLQGLAIALVVTAAGVVAGSLTSPLATSNFVLAGVLTVCVALGTGVIPAISVYRGSSVRALRGSAPIRHVGGPGSIRVLAARELMVQSRTASIVAVGLLATGVIVFALVTLIAAGFSGSLDTTILGRHVAAQAEPYHFVIGTMVLVLAAVANAQLLMLAYEEKRTEIAVLQAVGWPLGAILRFVAWQGLLLATAGAAIGVLISMLLGAALGSSFVPLLLSALAGGTAGFFASAVAAVAVLWHVTRVAPLEVLRGG